MITSEPIGDWTWDVPPNPTAARASTRALELAVAAWKVLAKHELALPVGKITLSVRAADDMSKTLFGREGLSLEKDPLMPGSAASEAVAQADALKGDCITVLQMQCAGFWLESDGKHRAEKLFTIQVDSWTAGPATLTLATYSDAWLTIDLREREQFAIHAENAPRLNAALREISELVGGAPDPGDPNRHATPTETGFEDVSEEGPAYVDSWGTFEIPARSRRLVSTLPSTGTDYPNVTDSPVRFLRVQRRGETLGYVWASLANEAAGYEPRNAAGDDAFEAGTQWLLRLREACGEGLVPLDALGWLAELPPDPDTQTLIDSAVSEAPSLDALEELSGRY
ncbi:hypothetical protein ACFW95_09880 [Streptomyces sp. NPDC059474]|uniref:hypothetical protein n=1 Tax=unclassified Streptomyces TaxID=2593676 RepID=UPI003405E55C